MVTIIINFTDYFFNFLVRYIQICLLDCCFKFRCIYFSRIVFIHFCKLLFKILDFCSINHFNKHIHGSFSEFWCSFICVKSVNYSGVELSWHVIVTVTFLFNMCEPWMFQSFISWKSFLRIDNKKLIDQI